MSADNWTACPRCLDEAKRLVDEASAEVYAQYGKVPPEEFDRLREELPIVNTGATFREDYEFYGAEEGTVHARYSGSCTECGLRVSLDVDKKFYTEGRR